MTRLLGSTVRVLVLLALGLVLYLATSKYGNIRLGEGKVDTHYPPHRGYLCLYCRRSRLLPRCTGALPDKGLTLLPDPGAPTFAPQSPKALRIQHPLLFLPLGRSAWAKPYALASLIVASSLPTCGK
ncbi:hypothetical protein LNQ52_29560 [Klebsiella pneumoniae subsp. pneumoniae]|nr:hypothetical protein [Klebsiella pneumoniae subsp. pneumoniae]